MAHLVKRDERFMITRATGFRVWSYKLEHLHDRTAAVGRRGHVGIIRAAEIVSFSENRITTEAAATEIIFLSITRGLVKTRFVPPIMQPVHVKEHSDETVLQICRSEERRVGKECRSRWSLYH